MSDTESIDKVMGKHFAILRRARNLYQQTIADHIGISIHQYRKYERGKATIPFGVVVKVARAMNVPLSEMIEPFAQKSEPLYSTEWIEQARARLARHIFDIEDPQDLRMFQQLAGLSDPKTPEDS